MGSQGNHLERAEQLQGDEFHDIHGQPEEP